MKKTKLLPLALLFAAASFGCDQSSLLGPENSESGGQGTLTVKFSQSGENVTLVGDTKELTNDLGLVLNVNHAELGLKTLRILSSGDDPECVGGNDATLALNGSQDLLGADSIETAIGSFPVTITGYCSYELTLGGTATAGALKFHAGEDHGDGGLGGNSTPAHAALHLRGSWMKAHEESTGGLSTGHAHFSDDADDLIVDTVDTASLSLSAPAAHVLMADFDIEIAEDIVIAAGFQADEDGDVIAHPLHFHGTETARDVSFGVHYDTLFRGVDFSVQTDAEVRAKIIENLKAAVFQKL